MIAYLCIPLMGPEPKETLLTFHSRFVRFAGMTSGLIFNELINFKTITSNKMKSAPSNSEPMGKTDIRLSPWSSAMVCAGKSSTKSESAAPRLLT